MPDRKNVINEFMQYCDSLDENCPVILLDTLKLLNPVTVKARFYSPYCGNKVGHSQCPCCGKAINSYDNPKACGQCGQMVEWV